MEKKISQGGVKIVKRTDKISPAPMILKGGSDERIVLNAAKWPVRA